MPRKARAEFEVTAADLATRTLNRIDSRLVGLGRSAKVAEGGLAAVGGGLLLSQATQLTDEYTRMRNQVEFLTRETADFGCTHLLAV